MESGWRVYLKEHAPELYEAMLNDVKWAAEWRDKKIATAEHALDESVKLQSHYAKLLNMHDGGERMVFNSTEEWLARLASIQVAS